MAAGIEQDAPIRKPRKVVDGRLRDLQALIFRVGEDHLAEGLESSQSSPYFGCFEHGSETGYFQRIALDGVGDQMDAAVAGIRHVDVKLVQQHRRHLASGSLRVVEGISSTRAFTQQNNLEVSFDG